MTAATAPQHGSGKLFERPPPLVAVGDSSDSQKRQPADDGDGVLTFRQCAALAADRHILNQLKSKELRRTLHIIDNSRARMEALDAAIHNIPEFRDLCKEILNCIDGAE
jgi:hypothetical protein